jgi:beta-aspartyl-peptidase (threonine type)
VGVPENITMKPAILVHGGAGSGRFGTEDRRYKGLAEAVESGLAAMKKGSGLEGAVAAVEFMEESGLFNCGRGACLTADGSVELDAAVMSGRGLAGAGVGSVTCTYHPVTLARWIMENTEHVLFVGEKNADYARLAGLKVERLAPSEASKTKFETLVREGKHEGALRLAKQFRTGDTVGAVALGSDGIPAAAVSTGGRWMKLPGRVGDSAILGAGIFADLHLGAACATGTGEEIIRCMLSLRACEFMMDADAKSAATKAIRYITDVRGKDNAGIITIDLQGRVGASFNTEAMGRAWYDPAKGRAVIQI